MSELVVVSHDFYKGGRDFVPYLHLGNYFQHLLERVKGELSEHQGCIIKNLRGKEND